MKTTGRATSFVTGEDQHQLRDIERLLGHAVPLAPGSEAPSSAIPAPGGGVRQDGHRSRSQVIRSQSHSFRNARKPHVEPSSYSAGSAIRT
jgi:ATP-dependent RNA helicase RhlE